MPTLLETTALRLTTQPQTQPDMWLIQTEADGIAFVNEHTENPLCPPYTLACIQTKDCGPFDADIDFDEHWVLMVTRKPTAEERTTQTRIENWVLNHTEILTMNTQDYDRTIIMFSGGKDSLACVLWAIENNCPNIELWHQLVDGSPMQDQTASTLMDWPITSAYCRAVARLLSLPIYFSWLDGGFEREMNRSNQAKAKTWFETPDGLHSAGGNGGKKSTRQKFPQVSADLSVRWCSAYLKVDVGAIAIRNQSRFNDSKTLVITGERAEESPARAKYAEFEPDRTDNRDGKSKRHVDRFRPIHGWEESEIWAIIQRHGIIPHPAYHLGWGRLSCMSCIFGSANQWATIRKIAPGHFERIASYEQRFCTTIQRQRSVREMADLGTPYAEANNSKLVKMALSKEWGNYPIWTHPQAWALPAGAFGESNGPT